MSTTTTSNPRTVEATAESMHLDALALAGAAAVVSAAAMLLLGVFDATGVHEGVVAMMEQWHLFFEPTVVGTVAGIAEAAVVSFVLVYHFAWLSNIFAR
ncbi:hypothetical protein VB773_12455 [Haloarculaceae archaeon H-GB2-1]|nr:hypothetical protein [Haloarculaceae archaeon H-GB1-1]MEA5386811.1 hypothetical protein [Haloarculaceae archaeon H-GB11]MEA5408286.1 hypothetical protein [Haloarculaceae archaeon H-GB2-1]